VPFQNQQLAIANTPLMALSQPSYAPSRIMSAAPGVQPQGANMFRQALLRVRIEFIFYISVKNVSIQF
jgi:hypothetical protein